MKKRLIVLTLLATALGGFVVVPTLALAADQNPAVETNQEEYRCGKRGSCNGPFEGRMAAKLNLTSEQQAQIKAIVEAERERIAPLREQMREQRTQLQAAMKAQPFDENTVRLLAASQAEARTEMIVHRARVQNQINTVLTEEQREQAEKLRASKKDRRCNKGHRGFGFGFDQENS
ncbi:MAG: Spy/CpxP family protein refolding chaperone [Desulfuromonadales bacterium]